ncbi:MAG: hypothetical protein VX392_00820 [Verrucomicrobiota bacterium]|nr:hypothetical protein [Verrucomicrobiota bacterium]
MKNKKAWRLFWKGIFAEKQQTWSKYARHLMPDTAELLRKHGAKTSEELKEVENSAYAY